MRIKLVILYPPPTNAESFETAYMDEHLPLLAARLPGMTRCTLSKVIWAFDAEAPFHLMAEIYFSSLEALQKAATTDARNEIRTHAATICGANSPSAVVCMEETAGGGPAPFTKATT